MAKLTEYLSVDRIRQGLLCTSKKRVLETASEIVAAELGIDEKRCFEHLLSREKMGCTGIGCGIALPHTKLPQGDAPMAVFLQLDTAVDYHTSDKREVDLVYALFIPEQYCESCCHLLSELAEKLSNKALNKQLRAAQSAGEIWEILQYFDNIEENTNEIHHPS